MKRMIAKILALLLVFATAIPMTVSMENEVVASAANVALTATKKTVILGNTYTVALKDSKEVSKKSFSSSNPKVATVNGKGVVTPLTAGSTKITCTVTLTSGATQKLNCNITVKKRVAATSLTLNTIHDKMNAHIIKVGEKYDFNGKLKPTTSTDGVYFTIADSEIASVTAGGVVTALKEGVTLLEARAGLNKTEASKATNKAVTRTYILVTPKIETTPTPTPTVTPQATGVTLISSKEIQIQFNTEIDKASVINSNGELVTGSVAITPGQGATAVSSLTAVLSSDMKLLNISTTGEFDGTYVVTVFNKIMTTQGQMVAPGSFQSDFKDTVGPLYVGSQIDDSGYICKLNFNEALDISKLTVLSVNGTNSTTIQSYLNNVGNYKLSPDKKSLTINLASLGEKALNVMVVLAGIKDIKGNELPQYQIAAVVQTDATPKPIANIVDVKRESKTLLVATFDRPIQFGGYIIVDNATISGVIDSQDSKKVNYSLTNTTITGTKQVTFSGFFNYNAINSSGNSITRGVDFTLDTTPPKAFPSELASTTENGVVVHTLTINYDKKISVVKASGVITALVNSVNGNIYSKEFSYTASAKGQVLELKFVGQTFEAGYYNFKLPIGLVMDSLENLSAEQSISVSKQAGSTSSLPQPTTVIQDPFNPSKIKVTFGNKLDLASARNVSNYIINNSINPISATIIEQSETNAVVELIFASGSFSSSNAYTFKIVGIKGFNDTYGTMKDFNTILNLVDNTAPQFQSCKLTSAMSVQIILSKNVTGTGEFQVYTSNGLVSATVSYVAGNTIYLTVPTPIVDSTYMIITKNEFKDSSHNLANIPTQFLVEKGY